MFLSVHVRLLIYLLRCTYYLLLTCVLYIFTVSKLQFWHREARLRSHGFWLGFRWCSAFSHPLPTTSCFCLYTFGCSYTCYGALTFSWPVYCIFSRFRSCSFGTVRRGCERTVFGSALDGVRPCRIRCQWPHVFVCAGSVAYIPATVQLPVLTCVLCILCIFNGFEAAVSAPCGTVAIARF